MRIQDILNAKKILDECEVPTHNRSAWINGTFYGWQKAETLTPLDQVRALYTPDYHGTFEEDLEYYLRYGYVVSMPTFFCMAEQIDDAWHIYAYAGDMSGIFKHAPYPLPFVTFDRRGKPRTYAWDVIYRKIVKSA